MCDDNKIHVCIECVDTQIEVDGQMCDVCLSISANLESEIWEEKCILDLKKG